MNISKLIQSALEYYRAGNLPQAEQTCRNILKKQPKNYDALHFLGAIYSQLGQHDLAIKYSLKALQYNSKSSEAQYNLGTALQAKGQLDDAITSFQKALQLNPTFVKAQYNLGTALQAKGQLDDAITSFQKALQLNPDYPDAYYNMGTAFQDKGHFDDAVACYQKALRLNPKLSDAYYNLGIIFQAKDQLNDAIACYQKAIQLDPHLPDAYCNMGAALQAKGHFDDAVACHQKAIQLDANCIDAYINLGNTLQVNGQIDDAVSWFQKALTINPYNVTAYYNLGTTLHEQGRHDRALAAFDIALFFDPGYVEARWNRCFAHLPIIYPDHASIQGTRIQYHKELLRLRDIISQELLQDIDTAARAVGSLQPFYLTYQGLNDRELQQIYGTLVCQIMASRYPQFAGCPSPPSLSFGEPIRVGIVSGFFYYHSNWKMRIRGWVENLDKKRINLYGYHTGTKKDEETEIARRGCYRFVEDIYSFEDLCSIIREDNLHVLIYPEIGMFPKTARLAALRLAPIQCTSWGHPDTSGFPTIDYFLSSDLMEPSETDDSYTENLVRLPNLSVYYEPFDIPSVDVHRDTFGLRPTSTLYLCCQSLFKYLPQYDEIYPRIAQQVGDCQFIFISHSKSRWVTEQFRSRIIQAFHNVNLNADDYIVFLPFLDFAKYYAVNSLADVYLDSIDWSGCNTTLEALACNLPVVTLLGNLMRGRHSSAILTMMGVTETIATNLDEYVSMAVKLGQDVDWRHSLSDKIAKNKHLAYRDRTCITALEDFLEREVKKRL